MMKAAVLSRTGTVPAYTDFTEPKAATGQAVVHITAAGVHHLDIGRASGAFGVPATLPYVIGADGVGYVSDGRRVFFTEPISPFGSWAQRTVVPEANLLELAEGVDYITAAALGNTGLAAWLALTWRANLQPGESVLVLGGTGAVGSAAVQIAKALGAGRVVAADRNPERLARAESADATVIISPNVDLVTALRQASDSHGFDVIIDPLWGAPALAALQTAAAHARHIQIGQSADSTIELPAHIIRGARIELLGFAHTDPPSEIRREAYRKLTELAATGVLRVDTIRLPLAECEKAWKLQTQGAAAKLVLTPDR